MNPSSHHSASEKSNSGRSKKSRRWLALLLVCGLAVWWFLPARKPASRANLGQTAIAPLQAFVVKEGRLHNFGKAAPSLPLNATSAITNVLYMFDSNRASGTARFLVGAKWDRELVADGDQVIGQEMWLTDEAGHERLIHPSVRRACFSPDGSKIAFTTTDFDLHVETVAGEHVATLPRAYDPSWRQDGNEIAVALASEGNELNQPDEMRIGLWDYQNDKLQTLTTGEGYDHLPHHVPASDRVLFVSAGRSGWASFYMMSASGGEPIELTREGMNVPVPYARTMWSKDGRWFIYDAKDGDIQETWGLQIDAQGNLQQATKLADGIDPQVMEDGSVVSIKHHENGEMETVVSRLPEDDLSPTQRVAISAGNSK